VFTIRRAVLDDAAGIVRVLGIVAAERVHSAIDVAWTLDEERRFLQSLSPREAIHVAVDDAQRIVGLQVLERWSAVLSSMAHVGEIGTFLLPAQRRQGLGRQLWHATLVFARRAGYRNLVIQVRGSNTAAQAFYRCLGFVDCGRLTRQVVIDDIEDDEVLMERFVS